MIRKGAAAYADTKQSLGSLKKAKTRAKKGMVIRVVILGTNLLYFRTAVKILNWLKQPPNITQSHTKFRIKISPTKGWLSHDADHFRFIVWP